MKNMWANKQFWLDSSWRAFRTFCQSLAGLLLAVQTSNQVATMPEISIPWYGYVYSSAIAALGSLLQSIDRERAVEQTSASGTAPGTTATTPSVAPSATSGDPAAADYQP